MRALDATLRSRERPALVSLAQRPDVAHLTADPFCLGQTMLGPGITLGDQDDAIITFGAGASVGR